VWTFLSPARLSLLSLLVGASIQPSLPRACIIAVVEGWGSAPSPRACVAAHSLGFSLPWATSPSSLVQAAPSSAWSRSIDSSRHSGLDLPATLRILPAASPRRPSASSCHSERTCRTATRSRTTTPRHLPAASPLLPGAAPSPPRDASAPSHCLPEAAPLLPCACASSHSCICKLFDYHLFSSMPSCLVVCLFA
jgi:hypothetical protein